MIPRILICDNNEQYIAGVCTVLGKAYKLDAAFTVAEATEKLDADQKLAPSERFAVVVVDLTMPLTAGDAEECEEAGFKILAVAKQDVFVEVIVLTGTGSEPKACRAVMMGAFMYVIKAPEPAGVEDLEGVIALGVKSHEAIVGLALSIERLAVARPTDDEVLRHANAAFGFLCQLRRGNGGGR
jgi:CheY-like chemotaxis protein